MRVSSSHRYQVNLVSSKVKRTVRCAPLHVYNYTYTQSRLNSSLNGTLLCVDFMDVIMGDIPNYSLCFTSSGADQPRSPWTRQDCLVSSGADQSMVTYDVQLVTPLVTYTVQLVTPPVTYAVQLITPCTMQ